jgi:hypothetical protein
MINKALLTPANIAVIGVISLVAHALAKPLYKSVSKKG